MFSNLFSARNQVTFCFLLTVVPIAASGQDSQNIYGPGSPTYLSPEIPQHLRDFQTSSDILMAKANKIYEDGMQALQPGSAPARGQAVARGNSLAHSVPPAYASQRYADYWMPRHIATAQNLVASSRVQELFMYLNSAMHQQPSLQAPLLCLRSRTFRAIGRKDDGWRDLNQALQLAPADFYVLWNRAAARYEDGDLHGALQELDRLVNTFPARPDVYRIRAGVRAMVGRHDEANQDMRDFQARLLASAQTVLRPESMVTSEQSSMTTVPYSDADHMRILTDRIFGQLENELARLDGLPMPHPEKGRLPGAGFNDHMVALRQIEEKLADPNVPPEVKDRIRRNLAAAASFERGWAIQQGISNSIQDHNLWNSVNNQTTEALRPY